MPACTPVCVAQTCKLVGPLCTPAMNGERWPLESLSHNADAAMLHPMSLNGSRSGRPRDRATILIPNQPAHTEAAGRGPRAAPLVQRAHRVAVERIRRLAGRPRWGAPSTRRSTRQVKRGACSAALLALHDAGVDLPRSKSALKGSPLPRCSLQHALKRAQTGLKVRLYISNIY
jgi:hypothetical protein